MGFTLIKINHFENFCWRQEIALAQKVMLKTGT